MYQQKMCYIDLYKSGIKCGNMGHVRLEWEKGRYRFGASLCHMDRQTLVTLVIERVGRNTGMRIKDIAIIHGKGNYQSDWLTIEGNEERMLFEASGGIYGVCVLPAMEQEPAQNANSGVEGQEQIPLNPAGEADSPTGQEALKEEEEPQGQEPWEKTMQEGEPQERELREEELQERGLRNTEPQERELQRREQQERELREEELQERELRNTESQEEKPQEREPQERELQRREPQERKLREEVLRGRGRQVRELQEREPREKGPQRTAVQKREMQKPELLDDKWEQLCRMYPVVHPIGNQVDFLKITPEDFVVLRQEYQGLVRNSFLLHGYYNYNHILLGKYPDKYYIGVPGIMHEQERLAAAMFGFVGFEAAMTPKEQRETGDRFGYYMMEVEI